MNNILIINQYASNPNTGFGGRSYYIAEALAKDNKVSLVCGSFNHLLRSKDHQISYTETGSGNSFKIKSLKLFKYSGSRSFLRIVNWFIFSLKLFFLSKAGIGFQPSVIVYSSPALPGYLGAYFLSKKFSCDLYLEVRDIWPLSVTELGGFSKNNPLIFLLRQIEIFAYKTAKGIISNLKDFHKYIDECSIKIKKFHYSPNGIVENSLTMHKSQISHSSKNILNDLSEITTSGKLIIGYVGGLAPANAMDLFIETACSAKEDDSLFFVVVGDGPVKKDLENMCLELKLKNIKFYDGVAKNEVPIIMEAMNILFLAHQFKKIYSYGISPMKLPEYIKSQKPIIHVTNSQSLLNELNCWEVVREYSPSAVIESIYNLKKLENSEKKEIGKRASSSLVKRFNYNYISNSLLLFLKDQTIE